MSLRPDSEYPCLLDRIIGPASDGPTAAHGGITVEEYRRAVMRDLRWLLNSTPFPRLEPGLPPDEDGLHSVDPLARPSRSAPAYLYPHARSSVINYGFGSLAGTHTEGKDRQTLCDQLRETITRFEPRFVPGSVVVEMVEGQANGKLTFLVKATLRSLPRPEDVVYRSHYDQETRSYSVSLEA